jgi:asparagine synthase (glutamine-hydrolysing)
VAEICGQRHEVIPVGQDFLSQFPRLAERTVYLTDGAMDVSGSGDLFVNRMAQEIAPVRLTGNYGGEILRSIVAFKPMPLLDGIFEPQFGQSIRSAAETYFGELTGRRQSFVAFKQVPWHHFSRLCLELSQLTVRSPYLDNELVALAYQIPEHLAVSNAMSLRMINDGNSALGSMGTDRNLMHGADAMIDRLKHLYEEFTFRAEYAFDYGMPHWLAKLDNLARPFHIERAFLGRHKFCHFRTWYRQELSRYVKDILLDSRTLARPYYNASTIQKIVKGHTEGSRNHTLEIHRVLTAELIQRQLIEI